VESSEYDDLLEHYNDVLSRKQATAQTLKAIDDELRTIEARLWQIAEQRQAKQIVGSRWAELLERVGIAVEFKIRQEQG